MKRFELKEGEIAGFSLSGWVQHSGTVRLNGGVGNSARYIDEWPIEIIHHGAKYTLENVIKGTTDAESGERWEEAQYV